MSTKCSLELFVGPLIPPENHSANLRLLATGELTRIIDNEADGWRCAHE